MGEIQGNTYFPNLGDTADAIASYRRSLAIRQRLVERAPNDRVALADLADGYRGVGDMLAVMDSIPQAVGQYQQALRLRERVVAAAPADVASRSALAEAHVRLGDVTGVDGVSNLGDLPAALHHYQQALALREALVREALVREAARSGAPDDSSLHLNLATTLSNAGFLARSAGQLDTSIAYGRRAVAELESLTVRHPQNANTGRS